jgi:hypothetical protein
MKPARDGRTPNLVESRVIWQVLFDNKRLEGQKIVKGQAHQYIKMLENFDMV